MQQLGICNAAIKYYNKNDIIEKKETMTWKKIIRENYKDYDFLR